MAMFEIYSAAVSIDRTIVLMAIACDCILIDTLQIFIDKFTSYSSGIRARIIEFVVHSLIGVAILFISYDLGLVRALGFRSSCEYVVFVQIMGAPIISIAFNPTANEVINEHFIRAMSLMCSATIAIIFPDDPTNFKSKWNLLCYSYSVSYALE
ncbi:hypothetical protein ACOME3_001165 [Neoechinorhynchus agilis]